MKKCACAYHKKQCDSGRWYGTPTARVCHAAFQAIVNAYGEFRPWYPLLQQLGARDRTGALVATVDSRYDFQAMLVVRQMLADAGGQWARTETYLVVAGFVFLMYWSWPVVMMVQMLVQKPVKKALEKPSLRAVLKHVHATFAKFKVKNGCLLPTEGLLPSLRGSSQQRRARERERER